MSVKNFCFFLLIVFVSLDLFSASAMAQNSRPTEQESKAIAYGKRTLVSRIEKGMPSTPFESWLKKLAGPKAKILWEVNSCGEQLITGRDPLMCVEANAESGDMVIIVSIIVGTFKLGLTAKPIVRYVELHYEGDELDPVYKLRDITPAIRKAVGKR